MGELRATLSPLMPTPKLAFRIWRALSTFLSRILSCNKSAPPRSLALGPGVWVERMGRWFEEPFELWGVILVLLEALDSGRDGRFRLEDGSSILEF